MDYLDLKNKRETELRCQIRINRKNKLLYKRVKICYLIMAFFFVAAFATVCISANTSNMWLIIGSAVITGIMLLALLICLVKVCCPHCSYQRIRYGMGGKCCPSCGKTLIYSAEIEKIDIEMQEKGEGVPFE